MFKIQTKSDLVRRNAGKHSCFLLKFGLFICFRYIYLHRVLSPWAHLLGSVDFDFRIGAVNNCSGV